MCNETAKAVFDRIAKTTVTGWKQQNPYVKESLSTIIAGLQEVEKTYGDIQVDTFLELVGGGTFQAIRLSIISEQDYLAIELAPESCTNDWDQPTQPERISHVEANPNKH